MSSANEQLAEVNGANKEVTEVSGENEISAVSFLCRSPQRNSKLATPILRRKSFLVYLFLAIQIAPQIVASASTVKPTRLQNTEKGQKTIVDEVKRCRLLNSHKKTPWRRFRCILMTCLEHYEGETQLGYGSSVT